MFYSELAELRHTSETFLVGNFHYTLLTDDVISYYREYEGKDRLVWKIIRAGDSKHTGWKTDMFWLVIYGSN